MCPDLPDPDDGSVKVTGRYPGQKATYSCNEGYQLVGFATRSCSHSGKWSGKAPICKRELLPQEYNVIMSSFRC